jgi:hypothetical protein
MPSYDLCGQGISGVRACTHGVGSVGIAEAFEDLYSAGTVNSTPGYLPVQQPVVTSI